MSNIGMHPTADTEDFKFLNLAGRRVMPGVRLLLRFGITAAGMRDRRRWRSGLVKASPAVLHGLTSGEAGGGGHNARCMSSRVGRVAGDGLKVDAI